MENRPQLAICHKVEDGSKSMNRMEPLRIPEVGKVGSRAGREGCSLVPSLL